MTIEECIDILDDNFTVLNTHGHYTEKEEAKAIEMAIASLEAWEKVKAEIEELEIVYESYFAGDTRTDAQKSADWWKMDKQIVLQIIDKHLQEVTE